RRRLCRILRSAAYPAPWSWLGPWLQRAGRRRAVERDHPARRHGLRRSSQPIPARDRLSAVRRAGARDRHRRRAVEQEDRLARVHLGLRKQGIRVMRVTQPAVLVGNYDWSEELLPRAEYDARLKQVLGKLDSGLSGLVIYGNKIDNAALAYVSNFAPKIESAMALVTKDGKVRIHAAGSP